MMLDFICTTPDCVPPLHLARVAICAFLAVLFLQSGLDKVFNWSGELGWIREHFAKSPFKSVVPQLLGVITIFEVASGAVCAVAAVLLLVGAAVATDVAVLGVGLSAASLLQLFLGQRIAKDYAGAGALVPYFIVTLAGFAAFA